MIICPEHYHALQQFVERNNLIKEPPSFSRVTVDRGNIIELHIDKSDIFDIRDIIALTTLEALSLTRSLIKNIEPIGHLHNLTELSLTCNDIVNVEAIRNLPALSCVNLSYNNIESLDPILSSSSIKVVRYEQYVPIGLDNEINFRKRGIKLIS